MAMRRAVSKRQAKRVREMEEFWQLLEVLERRTRRIIVGQIQLAKALNIVIAMEHENMFDVNRIVEAGRRQTSVIQSMVAQQKELVKQLRDVQDDPEQLEEALTIIEGNTAIAEAAVQNTPADPNAPGGSGGSTGRIPSGGEGSQQGGGTL